MINVSKDIRWAFFFLVVAVLFGCVMRAMFVFDIGVDFRNLTHGHSHVGILGWLYCVLTSLFCGMLLEEEKRAGYKKILIGTHISVMGMMVSFPFGGYYWLSISFSSMFIICSYLYSYYIFKHTQERHKGTLYYKFVRLSLVFFIISTMAIWMFPVVIKIFGKFSQEYNVVIYTFMHFQYNGFVMAGIFGIVFRYMEIGKKWENVLLWGFVVGVLGSLPLSVGDFFKAEWIYGMGGVASVIWAGAGVVVFVKFLREGDKNVMLGLFLMLFLLKTGMLACGGVAEVREIVVYNRDLVIGYLHFVFLGVVLSGILYCLQAERGIKFEKWSIYLYIFTFLTTEGLIMYKGVAIWKGIWLFNFYFELLFAVSFLFLVCAVYWFLKIFRE